MRQYVKAVSTRAEFSIVVLLAFGYFILGSILSVFNPVTSAHISEAHLQFLLVYESIAILVLGTFLSVRGWKIPHFGFAPSVKDSIIGVGIAIVAYLSYAFIWNVLGSSIDGLETQADNLVTPDLNLVTVLIISVLNPVFEEVFVCGYVITALKKTRSVNFAINVSIGIRLAYHLYQGTIGVMSIIPLGLIFSYWFARTGRLWPLVIAHGIFDFMGLVAYAQM